jgi:hypothetical protein
MAAKYPSLRAALLPCVIRVTLAVSLQIKPSE